MAAEGTASPMSAASVLSAKAVLAAAADLPDLAPRHCLTMPGIAMTALTMPPAEAERLSAGHPCRHGATPGPVRFPQRHP